MVILTQIAKIRSLPSQRQLLEHAETVWAAVEKAASLTKQLLAFDRKQVLALEALDLNDVLKKQRQRWLQFLRRRSN
jgi:hypothetical protein